VGARNWRVAHRVTWSTCGGGRSKSGEVALASPVRQCSGSTSRKLHCLSGKPSRGYGETGGRREGLATVAVLGQGWQEVESLPELEFLLGA
jgi:hypothetical protein